MGAESQLEHHYEESILSIPSGLPSPASPPKTYFTASSKLYVRLYVHHRCSARAWIQRKRRCLPGSLCRFRYLPVLDLHEISRKPQMFPARTLRRTQQHVRSSKSRRRNNLRIWTKNLPHSEILRSTDVPGFANVGYQVVAVLGRTCAIQQHYSSGNYLYNFVSYLDGYQHRRGLPGTNPGHLRKHRLMDRRHASARC